MPIRSVARRAFFVFGALITFAASQAAAGDSIDLWVDSVTKQVFTEPGPGRKKLGTFVQQTNEPAAAPQAASAQPSTSSQQALASTKIGEKVAEKHWFDKWSIRGYTQLRYTSLWDNDGAAWFHPADKTVAEDQQFQIRRARLIFSGDLSDHLYMYIQ